VSVTDKYLLAYDYYHDTLCKLELDYISQNSIRSSTTNPQQIEVMKFGL